MIKINELKSIFISKIAKFLKIRLKCEFKIYNSLFLKKLKLSYPELGLDNF
jgi:hypothetical protein